MYTKTSFVALAKFSANVCWALAEQKRALQSERRHRAHGYHPIYSTRTVKFQLFVCHYSNMWTFNTRSIPRARIIYIRKREQLRLQMCILKSNCVGECVCVVLLKHKYIHLHMYIYTYI